MRTLPVLLAALFLSAAPALADDWSHDTPAGPLHVREVAGALEVSLGGEPLAVGDHTALRVEVDWGGVYLVKLSNAVPDCPADFAFLDTTRTPPALSASFSNCADSVVEALHPDEAGAEVYSVTLPPWQQGGHDNAGLIAEYQSGQLSLRPN